MIGFGVAVFDSDDSSRTFDPESLRQTNRLVNVSNSANYFNFVTTKPVNPFVRTDHA